MPNQFSRQSNAYPYTGWLHLSTGFLQIPTLNTAGCLENNFRIHSCPCSKTAFATLFGLRSNRILCLAFCVECRSGSTSWERRGNWTTSSGNDVTHVWVGHLPTRSVDDQEHVFLEVGIGLGTFNSSFSRWRSVTRFLRNTISFSSSWMAGPEPSDLESFLGEKYISGDPSVSHKTDANDLNRLDMAPAKLSQVDEPGETRALWGSSVLRVAIATWGLSCSDKQMVTPHWPLE